MYKEKSSKSQRIETILGKRYNEKRSNGLREYNVSEFVILNSDQ